MITQNLLKSVVTSLRDAPVGTAKKIAAQTGLAYDSVLRIKRGDITNPRFRTLMSIHEFFQKAA